MNRSLPTTSLAGQFPMGPASTATDDYAPCTKNGQNCVNDIYAVSLPSEIPSSHITWFQAQEACANAGKRLPTSAGGAPACRRVGPPPEMVGR